MQANTRLGLLLEQPPRRMAPHCCVLLVARVVPGYPLFISPALGAVPSTLTHPPPSVKAPC